MKGQFSKANIARVSSALKGLGYEIAAVDIRPDGTFRVITTAGQGLTIGEDETTLNVELAQHRKAHGYGSA